MNKRSLILLIMLGMTLEIAHAEPSSRVAWTPETLAMVKHADANHGQELAKTLSCSGCHAGNTLLETPHINGQSANYLFRQLQDYKDGSRSNAAMSAVVGALTAKDMADLAAWYAQQDAPAATPTSSEMDKAQRLADQGDKQRLIPACAACHGGNGEGKAQDIPRLAGQKAAYLTATLIAYKTGQRHNDVYRRMRLLAESLSEEEIRQLAAYYAGLH